MHKQKKQREQSLFFLRVLSVYFFFHVVTHTHKTHTHHATADMHSLWNATDVSQLLEVCLGVRDPIARPPAISFAPGARETTLINPHDGRPAVVVACSERLCSLSAIRAASKEANLFDGAAFHVVSRVHKDDAPPTPPLQWYLYVYDAVAHSVACTFDYAFYASRYHAMTEWNRRNYLPPVSKWAHYLTRGYPTARERDAVLLAMCMFFNTRVEGDLRLAIDRSQYRFSDDPRFSGGRRSPLGDRGRVHEFADVLKGTFADPLLPSGTGGYSSRLASPWVFSMHYHAMKIPRLLIELCHVLLFEAGKRVPVLKSDLPVADFATVHYHAAKLLFKDDVHYLSIFPESTVAHGPGTVLASKSVSKRYDVANELSPPYVYTGLRDKFPTLQKLQSSEVPAEANTYSDYEAKRATLMKLPGAPSFDADTVTPGAVASLMKTPLGFDFCQGERGLVDVAMATRDEHSRQSHVWRASAFGSVPSKFGSGNGYVEARRAAKRGISDDAVYMVKRHAPARSGEEQQQRDEFFISIGGTLYPADPETGVSRAPGAGTGNTGSGVDAMILRAHAISRHRAEAADTVTARKWQEFYERHIPRCVVAERHLSKTPLYHISAAAIDRESALIGCELDHVLSDGNGTV